MKNIIRVFPRRTNATPIDDMAFIGDPGLFRPDAEEVHISVTFTYDIPEAERLYKAWNEFYPGIVKIGGPAFGKPSGEFIPGMYIKKGLVMTSRGCNNKCWFCSVWKREGGIRELPITEGWNVMDDNILACSDQHVKSVFAMLKEQKKAGNQIRFTGGLEARILKPWHAAELYKLKPQYMYFAYDTPDDYEPLRAVSAMMPWAMNHYKSKCYCLIGFPNDSMEAAEKRLYQVLKLGIMPYAMLWKNENGDEDKTWRKFQREWILPQIIRTKIKEAKQ